MNSINALKIGRGSFLKLHNNYTMFTNGFFYLFIDFIKQEKEINALVFFKNSGKEVLRSYNSFDVFNSDLSFWNSWSSGFSIWKADFDILEGVEVNKMFPHTSLFLSQFDKKTFILNDVIYFENQEVPKKGGYDLFKTFAVDYLGMIEDAMIKGCLSKKTFDKIKKDLFYDFLAVWYSNTKIIKNDYTFHLDDIKHSVSIYYSKKSYYKLVFLAYVATFKTMISNLLSRIKTSNKRIVNA